MRGSGDSQQARERLCRWMAWAWKDDWLICMMKSHSMILQIVLMEKLEIGWSREKVDCGGFGPMKDQFPLPNMST
jgi:hypothetical protein